jgi:simple sugar transport system permease protein
VSKKINKIIQAIFPALLMVSGALLTGAILIIISGNDPIAAYAALLEGAFSNSYRISETFVKAIPLMLMALGVSIAFKNQIWNIGAGGQFTIGTILSVIVCLYFKLPPIPTIILSFIFAFIGGALWGGLAGWLKARFNANEVITTPMLDYIATYLLAYLVYGPMMDPNGFGYPQSAVIEKVLRLPKLIVGGRLHTGIFVAIAILFLMLLFWRSTLGFKIELAGQGNDVSRYAGIDNKKIIVVTMLLSGGLSGIAGWNEIHGIHFRLMTDLAGSYGSIAIVIALLGNLNPLGIAISAYFFSVLIVGGNTMQNLTGIPYSLVDIIQGLIVVFVITRTAFRTESIQTFFRKRRYQHNG